MNKKRNLWKLVIGCVFKEHVERIAKRLSENKEMQKVVEPFKQLWKLSKSYEKRKIRNAWKLWLGYVFAKGRALLRFYPFVQ